MVAEVSGPSSASPHDANPELTPSLEVIPLGERVPDQVLRDVKARAEVCKARLLARKKGFTPDSEPAGTPDMAPVR